MRFVYNNLFDSVSSASILASSEDTSYPLTNAQDQRVSKKWHSDDATTQTVVIDLGATSLTTVYALVGHNCTSTGTVTVVGNDTIASGLTWISSGESSTQTITYNADVMLKFITGLQHRYYKFTFSGQTEGSLQIGRIWLGTYVSVSPSSLDDFTITQRRNDTVVYGKNRQKYASIGNTWRRFELGFPRSSTTTVTSIRTLYDTVGNHSSFIFCNFDDLRTYDIVDPCYCSIDGEIAFNHTGSQFYTYRLTLEEDL